MKYTQLVSILRANGYTQPANKPREWWGVKGATRIRLEVHPERDMVAVYVDTPDPHTGRQGQFLQAEAGKVMDFKATADYARGKVETSPANIHVRRAKARKARHAAEAGKGVA